MSTVDDVADYLRHRVVGLLHVNLVGPGDRLPSIRTTSELLDADHRTVARAFRRLEDEGLVEVRAASGVYVASLERARSGVSSATAGWMAGVFLDAWKRRIPRGDVGEMMAGVGRRVVRCACIESTEDHMVALSAELDEDFQLEVVPVYIGADGHADEAAIQAIRAADLAATLFFHRAAARRLADAAETPLVVVGVNPELARSIDEILEEGGATVVASDPATIRRLEDHFAVTPHQGAVHPLLSGELDDLDEAEALGRPVLATRAARRDLGASDYHLLPPPTTLVAPDSARALLEQVAKLWLAGAKTGTGSPSPVRDSA